MQLDYWTNKAQIPTKGKKQRLYDMDAVETVMLIKQGKDKGLNLAAAIEAARRFRDERARNCLAPPAPRAARGGGCGRSLRQPSPSAGTSEMMSIGAGKTIVVDGDEPISISVCR